MTVQEIVAAILGPYGALVLSVVVLYVVGRAFRALWLEHLKADQDDRDQRDKAQATIEALRDLLRQSLGNNAEAIAAWNRRNEQDAARQRRADRNP
jgi:hypothetical protein